ncbi:MAG: hypothetical protein HUU10_13170 [Bacteroidetes bacterium]|nr:hypothetical protein [Bacteroidota bacterium]
MKSVKSLLLAAFLFLIAAPVAHAQLGVTVGVDAANMYVWRGGKLGAVAVQPSVDYLSPIGLGANIWFSGHGEAVDGSGLTTEIDYTLYYTLAVTEDITLSAGFINYVSNVGAPFGDDVTSKPEEFVGNVSEVNLGVKFPTVLFSPSLKFFKNVAASDANVAYEDAMYIEAAGGYDIKLTDDYTLSTSLVFGLGNESYTKDGDLGVCNIFPKVALPLSFMEVSITPSVGFIYNPSAFAGADESFFVAGIGIYKSF